MARPPIGLAATTARRRPGSERFAQLAAQGKRRKRGVNAMVAAIQKARRS
jgi:hypothetical protein